jgi:hypothetical protein
MPREVQKPNVVNVRVAVLCPYSKSMCNPGEVGAAIDLADCFGYGPSFLFGGG